MSTLPHFQKKKNKLYKSQSAECVFSPLFHFKSTQEVLIMLWKKGNERFALLIVAVVAVFGLILMFQNAGDVTGFAAKKAVAKAKAPAPASCTEWSKTSERRCNSAPRQNQVLAKYTCKSDASKTSWRLENTCDANHICENGACVNRCTDSDANPGDITNPGLFARTFNYTVAGTAHGFGGEGAPQSDFSDRCTTATMLREYACSRDGGGRANTQFISSTDYDCASEGTICENGACVKSPVDRG